MITREHSKHHDVVWVFEHFDIFELKPYVCMLSSSTCGFQISEVVICVDRAQLTLGYCTKQNLKQSTFMKSIL